MGVITMGGLTAQPSSRLQHVASMGASSMGAEKAKDHADATRVRCVLLPIPRAYHSAAVEAVRPVFDARPAYRRRGPSRSRAA